MSKFIDAIECELTGRKFAGRTRSIANLCIDSGIETPVNFSELVQVNVGLTYRTTTSCRKKDIPHVKENFIREAKHAIYGEFYEELINVERALYSEEYDLAIQHIRKIYKSIGR